MILARTLPKPSRSLKTLKLAAMLSPAQEEWIATLEDDLSHMP